MHHIQLPPGDLPSPRLLACASLAQGYERLTQACRTANVIALGPDGSYYLKITPSTELRNRLLVDFHRLDWCLDTTEFEAACWKAAYIFQALVELERWEMRGGLHEVQRFQATILALHDPSAQRVASGSSGELPCDFLRTGWQESMKALFRPRAKRYPCARLFAALIAEIRPVILRKIQAAPDWV